MHTTEIQNDAIALDDLFSVEDLAAQHSRILTVQSLRWQLRHRHTNGLDSACVTLRRKLLISKSRFERWLATQVGK